MVVANSFCHIFNNCWSQVIFYIIVYLYILSIVNVTFYYIIWKHNIRVIRVRVKAERINIALSCCVTLPQDFVVNFFTIFIHWPLNLNKEAMPSLFPRHVLSGIPKLPKMSGFWLCFPIVFILDEGNDWIVVWPVVCKQPVVTKSQFPGIF